MQIPGGGKSLDQTCLARVVDAFAPPQEFTEAIAYTRLVLNQG